ncbi:MAG: DUF1573 domain-containing protein [Muribaculaceae bacterium]|nr:DUF1573 domain-containing protein [Muribaculaceae bacterium]
MAKILFYALPVISLISLLPARGEVKWLEKEYDFGLIKEQAGPQTGRVRMVNTGPEEVVITGARPSCGCTGVEYTEAPIAPGDTATVSFTYNPEGRPGRFRKNVRVYVGDFDTYIITIVGNVLGAPESLSNLYPNEVGALRLSETMLPAGDVNYGSTRHFFVNGYNQTTDTIRPRWECSDPTLSVSASAEELGPGDLMTFSFYFNSRDVKEIGPVEIPVKIFADNTPGSASAEVIFTANVTPDFSRLTPEEVDNGPRCYLAPPLIDLGEIGKNVKNPIPLRFAIRNDGKAPLRIMRIYSQSDAIRISRRPSNLKPGKSAETEGSVNLSALPAGPFNIKIDVLTDDPLHPVRTVSVAGIKQ